MSKSDQELSEAWDELRLAIADVVIPPIVKVIRWLQRVIRR